MWTNVTAAPVEKVKDRQQLEGHDSRYITFLCGYSIYNIILYIKLKIIFFSI